MAQLEGKLLSREYSKFRGVDLTDDETVVSLSRSPNAVNVWKDYNSSLGQAIETRAGFRIIHHKLPFVNSNVAYNATILGIHTFKVVDSSYFFFHTKETSNGTTYAGKLYWWQNYPTEPAVVTEIGTADGTLSVGTEASEGFVFNESYYLLDGNNIYRIYDDNGLKAINVEDEAFTPTTFLIKKDGTAEEYQDYNVLTGKQKNEFIAGDNQTAYELRPASITDREPDTITVLSVKVDGADVTYSLNKTTLTLTSAPEEDSTIVVEFSQTNEGTAVLRKCKKACVYDNRVFLGGSDSDKTKFYFSALNNPAYFPAYNFELAGSQQLDVVDFVVMSSGIALVKKGQGGNGYLYSINGITTSDEVMPKAYRATLIASSIGGIGGACNFKNDIVYLSQSGLQAIEQLDLHNERNIAHRSSFVDGKLINEKSLENAKLSVFKDYLLILVGGHIYLADSRAITQVQYNEYEWFYWDSIGVNEHVTVGAIENDNFYNASCIKEFDDCLFLGTENGCVLKFNSDMLKMSEIGTPTGTGELRSEAYEDDGLTCTNEYDDFETSGRLINSYWCTAVDDFGYRNRFKRCNRRGGIADLKSFTHSVAKLSIKTDTGFFNDNSSHNGGYFDFSDVDFEDFTFNTSDKNEYFFKAKNKKWARISLKFYSDEIRKPFGIFGVTLEAFVQGYAKERQQ